MSTETNWNQLLSENAKILMSLADIERAARGDYQIQPDHLLLGVIHSFTIEGLGGLARDKTNLLVGVRAYLSQRYIPPVNVHHFPVEYSPGFQEVIHEARQQLVGLPYPSLIPHLIINALFRVNQGYVAEVIRDFALQSLDYPDFPYRRIADILAANLTGNTVQTEMRRKIYRFVTH